MTLASPALVVPSTGTWGSGLRGGPGVHTDPGATGGPGVSVQWRRGPLSPPDPEEAALRGVREDDPATSWEAQGQG